MKYVELEQHDDGLVSSSGELRGFLRERGAFRCTAGQPGSSLQGCMRHHTTGKAAISGRLDSSGGAFNSCGL